MNIALVIAHLDIKGGAQRQFIELASHLVKHGHLVHVYALYYNPSETYPLPDTIPVVYTPSTDSQWLTVNQQNGIWNTLYSFIQSRMQLTKRMYLLTQRILSNHQECTYDIVNYHDIQVEQLATNIPIKSCWMMNDLPLFFDLKERQVSKYHNHPLLPLIIAFEKLRYSHIVKALSSIIVLDNRNKQLVQKYFNTTADIVRSGLHHSKKFNPGKHSEKKVILLTTNIFFPHRRYEDVIEALNILINKDGVTNLEYHIVGKTDTDPIYYQKILSLIAKYDLQKNVRILGTVSDSKLHTEYERAHIFVFPNHNQTWGLSVFEALAHSCAVIVSTGAGAHEVLTHNKNALLYTSCNAEELAQNIKLLVSNTPLRKKLAKNGFAFVVENISWDLYTQSMTTVFKKIVYG